MRPPLALGTADVWRKSDSRLSDKSAKREKEEGEGGVMVTRACGA
jgi:hypothetical protein